MIHKFIALCDALIVHAHVQIHAGEKGPCGVQGYVYLGSALDPLILSVCEVCLGRLEVFHNLIIYLTDSGTGGSGSVNAYAKRHAGVVPALGIRHSEQGNHMEVHHCAEEIVLTKEVVTEGSVSGLDGCNVGVCSIDDLVGHPPGIIDILVGGIL